MKGTFVVWDLISQRQRVFLCNHQSTLLFGLLFYGWQLYLTVPMCESKPSFVIGKKIMDIRPKKNNFWKFFDNTWWKWLSSLFIKKYACRKAIWRKCNFFKSAFLIYMEICLFWSSMQLFIMCLNEKPCCFQRKKHYQHAWKMSWNLGKWNQMSRGTINLVKCK